MLRLHKLASEPEAFDPIEFHSGVNLILGERNESDSSAHGRKVNGVGKSLCIEFLHFALCRGYTETRLSKIPFGVLPDDLVVTLDLTVGNERIQIRRSLSEPKRPSIIQESKSTTFDSLDDATDFLGERLFASNPHGGQVSFRKIISVLMRDEASGFANILNPHEKRVPPEVAPHLYLLGIDLTRYRSLEATITKLAGQRNVFSQLRETLTERNTRKIDDIPALLNEERRASQKIEVALDTLKADPAFEAVEDAMVGIERELVRLRGRRKALSYQIDQIRSIPLPERIDAVDLKIVYDRVRDGLGDLVTKSLEDVQSFKCKLEEFQKALREKELGRLIEERKELNRAIIEKSDRHAALAQQIDQQGALAELRIGLEVATKRTESYKRLEAQYSEFEKVSEEVEDLKHERENELHAVRKLLMQTHNAVEESMNRTLSDFHERIMGNSSASFKIEISDNSTRKAPVSFDCRIEDDGSHSLNKERTFLYDFCLLFDPEVRKNHPGFLVHDNILEVDQDTTYRCLNFLHAQLEAGEDFQYILTLNRDKINSEEAQEEVKLNINDARVASLTKDAQFLKKRYQEL